MVKNGVVHHLCSRVSGPTGSLRKPPAVLVDANCVRMHLPLTKPIMAEDDDEALVGLGTRVGTSGPLFHALCQIGACRNPMILLFCSSSCCSFLSTLHPSSSRCSSSRWTEAAESGRKRASKCLRCGGATDVRSNPTRFRAPLVDRGDV